MTDPVRAARQAWRAATLSILAVLIVGSCQPAPGNVHLEGTVTPSLVVPSCLYLAVGEINYLLATLPSGYTWLSQSGKIVGPDGRAVASGGDRVFVDGKAFELRGDQVCATTHAVNVERLGRAPPTASQGAQDQNAASNMPSQPVAAFTAFNRGSATIRASHGLTADVVLDNLANVTFTAMYDSSPPGSAQSEWAQLGGEWLLTVLASADPRQAPFGKATLWIQRYGNEPPLYADGSRCRISIIEMSPAGLAGNAECRGLRWLNDYEAQSNPERASPIPGLAPFDVSITFEARP